MQLEMCYFGHPALRKKTEPITEITDEIRELAETMITFMRENDGMGLAAPQVGHNVAMFVICPLIIDDEEKGEFHYEDPKFYLNPKLSEPSEDLWTWEEGCLSFPKLRVNVERPYSITVEAMDLEGNMFKDRLDGWLARPVMHETDHLNGVLMIDRIPDKKERELIKPLLKKMKKKYNK